MEYYAVFKTVEISNLGSHYMLGEQNAFTLSVCSGKWSARDASKGTRIAPEQGN